MMAYELQHFCLHMSPCRQVDEFVVCVCVFLKLNACMRALISMSRCLLLKTQVITANCFTLAMFDPMVS